MEYVKIIYFTSRSVYIDGKLTGYTNQVLQVEAGSHRFQLDGWPDYDPIFWEVVVKSTTVLQPLEIVFIKKK